MFQAAIAEEEESHTDQNQTSNENTDTYTDDTYNHLESPGASSPGTSHTPENTEENDELSEIVGTKCRAPFKSEWKGSQYHNAIIVGVEPMVEGTDPMVI